MNAAHADGFQVIIKLAIVDQRRKEAEKIDHVSFFLSRFQQGIQALPDVHHGRFSALAGERVHIARTNRKTRPLLRFAANALHVRSEQRVNTGDANHYDGGLFLQTVHDLFDCLRNLFQMTPCDNIGFIHVQVEKPIPIRGKRADKRGVSPTAARRDQKHHTSRNRQSRALHAESLGSGRIERKRRR